MKQTLANMCLPVSKKVLTFSEKMCDVGVIMYMSASLF